MEERRELIDDYIAYDRYYCGQWWTPTGYEILKDGVWFTELENDEGDTILLN